MNKKNNSVKDCTSIKTWMMVLGVLLSLNSLAQETMPLPDHASVFTGNARGFWFTAPEDFTVTALKVPDDFSTTPQSIEFVRFNMDPPPLWSMTTDDFTSMFRVVDDTSSGAIAVALQISAGDHVGVLGVRSTDQNSYAAAGFVSQIGTNDVTLTRMGMQFPLSTTDAQQIFQENGGSISRVEITYVLGINYGVGVDVSGLNGNLVLENNGGDTLNITTDGPSQFAALLSDGAAYDVTIVSQPSNQVCAVMNGSGMITGANADVQVVCESVYAVAGAVVGLFSDSMLVLQNNGGDDLMITDEGAFMFSMLMFDQESYDVTVSTQPNDPIQPCMVSNGSGSIDGADVTNVIVTCEPGDDLIFRNGFE